MASYSTSMSITKVLHLAQMQVSKPSDQTVTLMVCVCSFDANASTLASSTKYMLRFLMNPSYSGGSFGASTSWRDVTPYYIDKVYTNKLLTKPDAANGKRYTFPTAAGEYYFAEDLVGAYIYVEDASFATPSVHIAEGDKITSSDHTWHDFTSATMSINTESNHPGSFSTWGGVTMDVLRIHKNLETGKIPYDQLCSDSSTFFDQYTFSSEIKNERIILSMHTGDSGRANMTLGFNYVDRTYYGTSENIWSRADYVYNDPSGFGVDVVYDRHLVYGFPNYDSINKSNVSTVFNGKTLTRWTSGSLASAASAGSATISSYDKIAGQIGTGNGLNTGATSTNNLYKIGACDVSVVVDDFIISEFDVHGRYGGFYDFNVHLNKESGYVAYKDAGTKAYNIPDYTVAANRDYLASSATEVSFTAGDSFHAFACTVYDGFRIGLHSDSAHDIAVAAGSLGLSPMIPGAFNRNITHFIVACSKNYSATASMTSTDLVTNSKALYNDNLSSGWEYRLCYVDSGGSLDSPIGYSYTKVFRHDGRRRDSTNIGGNHLSLTGNPAYSKMMTGLSDKNEQTLSSRGFWITNLSYDPYHSYLMVKDYSFGAKYQAILRDRLFMAVCKFQEYQINSIQSTVFEDNENVFMSPIAEFGGNYHTYDANTLKIPAKEIAPITGLAVVNIPQGLQGSTQADRNQLLILGERGYKYVEIGDSGPTNERSYNGDCCVAPKSVVYDSGLAFCAGNNGVYMFQASEKTDITMMGASKINKTWRSLSRSVKQTAIGVFNKDRGLYMLAIPSTNTIYCFDLREAQIYTFSYADSVHFAKLIQAGFHINKLWLAFNDGVTSYMDDSVATDWDGNNNDSITASFTLNNINPSGKYAKIEQFGLGYTATGNISPTVYVDGSSYSLTESSGTNKYIERSIKKNFNSRGRQFSFSLSGSTISEVFDLDVTFADVVQKKLIRGELN